MFLTVSDTKIDPSLHERQRLLKKARLTDSLNDKLSHRPGILELVQGNILQPDGTLHQLIKGNFPVKKWGFSLYPHPKEDLGIILIYLSQLNWHNVRLSLSKFFTLS